MANVFEYIADLMTYWTGSRLPPELRRLRHSLIGETMERWARLGLDSGIYEVIGGMIPPQCENPGPAMRRVMSEVSAAFFVFEEYRQRGIEIGPNVSDPLARSLYKFLKTLGEPRRADEVRAMVENYLSGHSVCNPVTVEEFFNVPVLEMPLLNRLREYEQRRRKRRKKDTTSPWLHEAGLGMDEELDSSRYNHATPLNARTFANTGGDGVHFSLMIVDGVLSEDSPVIVTDPTAGDNAHAIVGENLREFLNLGYHTGYVCFQSLVYEDQRGELLDDLLTGPAVRDGFQNDFGYGQPMMAWLRKEFDLSPWREPNRFVALQEQYKPLLKAPPR